MWRRRQVGVDAACATDPDDDAPIEQATVEEQVLLTQDRELLRRLSPLTDSAQVPTERREPAFRADFVNAATERS